MRKLEQKFHCIKDGQCLKLSVYKCIYSPHLILQWGCRGVCARVCVSRWLSHPTQCDYEKKCFSLSLLHIYIPAHTDCRSTSLQKHCSNNPWIAGLCWRPTTSPLESAPSSTLKQLRFSCCDTHDEDQDHQATCSEWVYILFTMWEGKNALWPLSWHNPLPPPWSPSSPPSSRL